MALTAEQTISIWRYEPDTGLFFWLVSPKYDIIVGSRAGYFDGKYWRLSYKGKTYKASRVAWLIMTGDWPPDQIDHANRVRIDDRFDNLRLATNAENCRNRSARSDNKLGVKGVYRGRYSFIAQICVDGSNVRLGAFNSLEDAKAAYDSAAAKLHGEFARI